ncbi:MAG TPA: NADH-quinone oxidoreductase subunit NuoE [Bacteroidales bacterium]|nr:NADH-quinone oxidoreductase subunit NuoE [Bacteroidales bacterium]HOX78896.1 NADH-quinone oxidoreductase subunit NuoE [Bacteroidales bacterium]HPI86654.1 NADH-quinone oxidoreductase subunit NuoE [Bacteroidales bacterium]HPM92704.1 NADH-quinone oxidoreductase subunit NuoE [Bacteroidales bacterium]
MSADINQIITEYSGGSENLIPILQKIQDREGFLSRHAVIEVGKKLDIPASKIYGVATFYNQFRFEALGKYHVQVCRGTACHVLGSATVLQELEKMLRIKAGQTTRDGLFSMEVVACIGACGLAPVICINGEFHAKVTKESLQGIIDEYRNRE